MNPSTSDKHLTVIGIGRLGICLALCLEKAGYHVLGVDLSTDYISHVNAKTLVSKEPAVREYLQNSKNFHATTSLKEGIDFSDTCFVIVPTNTVPDIQSYDHSILSSLLKELDANCIENKHIVICATVFPGFISKTAPTLISHCKNTTISYNPEFIAQGNIIQGLRFPDLVLIGEGSPAAGDRLESIYKNTCLNSPAIARMSIASAEITKLAVNCFITAKIAFANLISDIANETSGANPEAILNAVGKDHRINPYNLKPGFGFGGPCFPRDNRALGNYASLLQFDPSFFRSTDQTNESHANYMAKKLLQQNLNEYVFEDVSFKPNCAVPIIENSQKLVVAKIIAEHGKTVTIIDNEEVLQKVQREYQNLFNYLPKKSS